MYLYLLKIEIIFINIVKKSSIQIHFGTRSISETQNRKEKIII